MSRSSSFSQTRRQSALAEPALLRDLLDAEVAAHGEVDDGGGDVERVGHARRSACRPARARRLSGGTNSTGVSPRLEQRDPLVVAGRRRRRPRRRRSRRSGGRDRSGRPSRRAAPTTATSSSAGRADAWPALSENASRQLHRSSRIGAGGGTSAGRAGRPRGQPLAGAERAVGERARLPSMAGAVARAAPSAPGPAKQATSVTGPGRRRSPVAVVDRDGPLGADGVPVELVVVVEAVERALEPVGDARSVCTPVIVASGSPIADGRAVADPSTRPGRARRATITDSTSTGCTRS